MQQNKYPKVDQFPVTIKCYNVGNSSEEGQLNITHTFMTEDEYKDWLKAIKKFEKENGKPNNTKYKVLSKVIPRLSSFTTVNIESLNNNHT